MSFSVMQEIVLRRWGIDVPGFYFKRWSVEIRVLVFKSLLSLSDYLTSLDLLSSFTERGLLGFVMKIK